MTVFHEPFNLFMVNIKFETNKLSQYSFFARNNKFLVHKIQNIYRRNSLTHLETQVFFNVNTFMAYWKGMYAKYMTRNM